MIDVIDLDFYPDGLQNRETLPECKEFDAMLSSLDSIIFRRAMADIEQYDLEIALHGCSFASMKFVLSNFSQRMQFIFLNDHRMHTRSTLDQILASQRRITGLITYLNENGLSFPSQNTPAST